MRESQGKQDRRESACCFHVTMLQASTRLVVIKIFRWRWSFVNLSFELSSDRVDYEFALWLKIIQILLCKSFYY